MKAILLRLTAVVVSLTGCSFIAQAQSALPCVLASAGGTGTVPGGATFNFTLGEPFVATIGVNPRFTQGFQQPSTSGIPLPVYLLDFSGIAANEYNFLSWHTAQEKNNNYFDVERSRDGIVFHSTGRVYSSARNGSSSEKIAYTFADKTMPAGVSYYRLRQVDQDGQQRYSFIISLERTGSRQTGFTLSPNPTKGKVCFSIAAITEHSFIQINDISGKAIQLIQPNTLVTEIDLSNLANGVYFIRYTEGQNSSWAKVVKE